MSANVSHGRGGAANIRPDDTPYADGEITREGPIGDQGDGPYSAGRGGVGNIAKDGTPDPQVGDEDIVPETATRTHRPDNYHFGRGGAGNEFYEKPETPKTTSQHGFDKKVPNEPLKDKIKDVFHKH
ncbi:hypothetical protein PMZ80_006532 [Knufia obscura]|uniref:Uncharacterized protein n=2 Tax=Knufia TaxID=430999 RepID=A0AAN8F454_9EURO|nr:hypothetical protein PMZ80_006532 [Knufia obscura]KAK5950891.1 hypothetical protein OHC33_007962 [Knufia fluminis]